MDISDALAEHEAEQPTPKCKLARLLDFLDPDDEQVLADLIANPDYAATTISAVLAKSGFVISDSLIGRHRKGTCRCPSETS